LCVFVKFKVYKFELTVVLMSWVVCPDWRTDDQQYDDHVTLSFGLLTVAEFATNLIIW